MADDTTDRLVLDGVLQENLELRDHITQLQVDAASYYFLACRAIDALAVSVVEVDRLRRRLRAIAQERFQPARTVGRRVA